MTHPDDSRQSWDAYFLDLARAASTRATCSRRQVGTVIVKDRRVKSTGFNGAPSGLPHCLDGGCPRSLSDTPSGATDYGNCTAVHSEVNALLFASPDDRDGATLYCTDAPCWDCSKAIANSGVAEVVAAANPHSEYDRWERSRQLLLDAGVRVRLLVPAGTAATLHLSA